VDFESEGDGTLTVLAGKTVTSNKSDVTITAWDVDLDGSLTGGEKSIVVHGSKIAQTTGLGATALNMHIDAAELQRIIASNGFYLSSFYVGSITVNAVSDSNSNNVGPIVNLIGTHDNSQVTFTTATSGFNALVAQADNGIYVQADITTDTGVLTLDGDSDNATAEDGHDKIAILGARTLSAIGQLTLDSTSGGIVRSGTATMTLTAQAGILVNDDFASQDSGQILVINADSNDSGAGTFTIASSQALSTNNGVLRVTAADVDIQGTITTGTEVMHLHGTNERTIGIGTTASDMDVEAGEVGQITSTGIVIGDQTNNKEITVEGIATANSNTITVIVTLVTTVDDSSVTFSTTSSSFHTLAAQADNAVDVEVDVTATIGAMYLDGDYENSSSADTVNDVEFVDEVRVAAETLMTSRAPLATSYLQPSLLWWLVRALLYWMT